MNELIIPLPNGNSLRCGEGDKYEWGGRVRICDGEGIEIHYWDANEWAEDPECVMGAIFKAAIEGKHLFAGINRERDKQESNHG